ncbi:MAG: hypothetical protein SP4CHLAM5_11770 [Chlamydiia bacterium]|nr:hypothetical protein [Chlamydiia bacterium]MCH9619032.1 hypothetical protein [Chlamydiia bacterium]MCH9624378.1 hypothetical protein [Chlamydiia bacterium]
MSGNPKITDDQININSSVLLSLVDTDASKAHKKRLLKAAAFEKLESVVDTVTQSSSAKAPVSASDAPQGDSFETFSGRNLYINNGISVEALLEMLKNDTKTANEGYKLYGTTAMLKGGFSTDSKTGVMTKTSAALVTQEGDQIIASGKSDAASKRLEGIKGAVDGFGQLGSEFAGALATRGGEEEDQANVDKLQNALDFEKEIPQGQIHATDAQGAALDEEGSPIQGPTTQMKRAITALTDNGYDVTEGSNHFGSSPKAKKRFAVEKAPDHEGAHIDTGNNTSVRVRDALEQATVQERADIRSNLQKRLNKAKDKLTKTRENIMVKRRDIAQKGSQLTQSLTSFTRLSQATSTAESAQARAEQVVAKNMSDSETGLMQKQNEGIAAATKNQTSALDLLRQMYAQLGKRG